CSSDLRRFAGHRLRVDWEPAADDGRRTVSGALTSDIGDGVLQFPRSGQRQGDHRRHRTASPRRTHHSLAQQLRERGWGGYADSAGNASLRGNRLFVEITGRRDTGPAAAVAATAPYTRAGLPVTFALLASAEHFVAAPTRRALADSSGASLGTVNRVLRALRERTPPTVEGRHNDLMRQETLDREWIC